MTSELSKRAHRIGMNAVPVYYRGGARISKFRGLPEVAGSPEDWVASVSVLPPAILQLGADPATGCSRLSDGTLIRDAVRADPEAWLGDGLARSLTDGEVGVLVKLLDAGERLPVHCHPSRHDAQRLLGSRFGKTEGWLVLGAEPGSRVWLGLKEELASEQLLELIEHQRVLTMLALMNEVSVQVGDVLFVPAGTPHAIGEGVFVAELQEPTSYSILAEHVSLGLNEEQATLGLGWAAALSCFDLGARNAEGLVRRHRPLERSANGGVESLFPDTADEFFRAFRLSVDGELAWQEPGYRVIIVTRGSAVLDWASGARGVVVRQGETWLAPYALGDLRASGTAELVVAMPPSQLPS